MWFETLICDFLNAVTFILCETLGEDRCIRDDGVMDLWKGNQIRLKLGQVNVQGAFETQGRGDGRYNYYQLFVQGCDYHLVR